MVSAVGALVGHVVKVGAAAEWAAAAAPTSRNIYFILGQHFSVLIVIRNYINKRSN